MLDRRAVIRGADPALAAEHLGERAIDGLRPEPGRSPAQEVGRRDPPLQALLELADEAGLTDPRLPDDLHEMGPLLANHTVAELHERGELGLTADHRRPGTPGGARAGRVVDLLDLPGADRLGPALQRQRPELPVVHGIAGRATRCLADQDASDRCRTLQSGSDVDRVAHDGVFLSNPPGQDLARVDSHPQRQFEPEVLGSGLVQLDHRGLHTPRRADGALGIVLVGDRGAEDGHHVVADVLVDVASVALHLERQPREVARRESLDALMVEPLGHRRVADDVGEQDGDPPSFLRWHRGTAVALPVRFERRSAGAAEPRLERRGRSAGGTASRKGSTAGHAEPRVEAVGCSTPCATPGGHQRIMAGRGIRVKPRRQWGDDPPGLGDHLHLNLEGQEGLPAAKRWWPESGPPLPSR